MVSADRVLLQHPVWDSGFALRHVFLHPHLLHLLWMSRLKLGRSFDRQTQLEGGHVKKAIIYTQLGQFQGQSEAASSARSDNDEGS